MYPSGWEGLQTTVEIHGVAPQDTIDLHNFYRFRLLSFICKIVFPVVLLRLKYIHAHTD